MLIGELAKKSGLSRDTIRFYEKQGLIAVDRKERRFNNYKDYSEETLRRLITIKRIKSFGFTLNDAAEFMEMIEGNTASCNNVAEKFTDRIALIDKKIAELESIKQLMEEGLRNCLTGCVSGNQEENCPIVAEQFS